MKRVNLAALALVTLVLGIHSSAYASGPDSFTIRTLVYAGSGCPAGSVANNVSPDAQAFTLLFDNYLVEVGPGVPFGASRKNCQLNITFDCPAGWSFALVDLDTRGYVALEPGVRGIQRTAFYFQGDATTGSFDRELNGPMDEDFHVRDTVAAPSRIWGHCGANSRALNINTSVRLDNSRNRSAHGLFTVDSIDGSVYQVYGLSGDAIDCLRGRQPLPSSRPSFILRIRFAKASSAGSWVAKTNAVPRSRLRSASARESSAPFANRDWPSARQQ